MAANKPIKRIAFVLDGPEMETKGILGIFKEELQQLLEGDFRVTFPGNLVMRGDYSRSSVRRSLDQAIGRTDADLIVTLGPLASRQACIRGELAKPVIAAMVLDHVHQRIPYRNGTSGRKNLTYIEMPDTFREDLLTFFDIVPFRNLALLGGRSLYASIPDAEEGRIFRMDFINSRMRLLETGPSVRKTLDAMPAEVDAVYLLPIPEMSTQEHAQLLSGLAAKRIPVFSLIGHRLVRNGALAGLNKPDWINRLARRTALNARKILSGQDAGRLPVAISRQAQLMINMHTARIVGISPGFTVLTEATLIREEVDESIRELTLTGVMDEAVVVNLDLAAVGRGNAAGEEAVNRARSLLLPQANARVTGTVIDRDRAEVPSAPAEQTVDAALSLNQVIWSDEPWANLTIEKTRQLRRTLGWEKERLDVALNAASAYLNVLLAKTQQEILATNLRLSRSNLERAKMRRALGVASASEVYRLESQISRQRADVLQAVADRKVVEIELRRQLAYSLEQPFRLADVSLEEHVSLLLSPRITPYAQNPARLDRLKQFMVVKGLRASPELMQIDADIAVEKRQLLAAKRAFYAPDVTLSGEVVQELDESGTGADVSAAGGPDDTDWNVSLNVSIPLWEGGGRFADQRKSRQNLKSLRLQRRATLQRVEQRIRSAVHQAAASYLSIELLEKAAKASRQNFNLIADAYSRGTVPLIDLLDAQATYLQAEQSAASAIYSFLLDLMELERSMGRFTFFASNEQRDGWITELQNFFDRNKEK
jgi:outer membrane protein TolC